MPAALDLDRLDAALVHLCALAAAETLPRFRQPVAMADKGGARFDPVTEADRAAERALRAAIAAYFPDHGVLGEEEAPHRPDAAVQWVIDPIDGTRAFIAGLPLWTTLIGVVVDGAPVLGAIAQPVLGELFIGGPGRGARLVSAAGTRPLHTRRGVTLADALIATTDPALFAPAQRAGWERLAAATRLARLGCDAYAMAMVADGRIDLALEAGLRPWDVAGPAAVVAGAGGVVADWAGGPAGPDCAAPLFAGCPALAAAAAELLAGAPGPGPVSAA
jgi:histidinol phosphatase-like enzyme (inositol monophosphatase family)